MDESQIEIKKGRKHENEFKSSDGKIHKISVYTSGLDYVPVIMFDGQEYRLSRKLEIFEWILSVLPLVTIAFGDNCNSG